jgi:hypothetical protein
MTEVPTQTAPAQPATVSTPVPAANPSVAASPVADNAHPNTQITGANLETQPGAGWGEVLEGIKTTHQLEDMIQLLDDDDEPLDSTPVASAPAPAAAPAPVATPAAPAPKPDDDGDGLQVPGKLPTRYKVPVDSEVDFHAGILKKEASLSGKPISWSEAESLAKQKLGLSQAPAPVPAAAPAGDEPAAPAPAAPVSELDTAITAAYAEYESARAQLDEVAEAKALRTINDLNRQKTIQELRESSQQTVQAEEAQATFNAEFNANLQQAKSPYSNPADVAALDQRASELQEQYAASEDPAMQAIYESPTSPLFFYQQAAAQLQIAPSAPSPVAPPVTPSPKPSPQPVLGPRPPVNALLASNPGQQTLAAPPGFNVDSITNIHQLESLVERIAE